MRVLLITNLFHPEPNHLKGLEFAKELTRRGHDVHVLTGFPNYPGGKVYPGYRVRWTLEEECEGVPVTRVAMYPSHDGSAVRRIASYVSVGLSATLQAVLRPRRFRFDVCHVYLGPITLMWAATALRALTGARIVADVQDIWPESVTHSGMLDSRVLGRMLHSWCRWAYSTADRTIVLSPGYQRALVERGVRGDAIDIVYNWCDERTLAAGGEIGPGVLHPQAFNVVYAGNLGKLQGIDTILDAAKRLAVDTPTVRITLIGDGVEAERLKDRIASERIENVQMVGRLPLAHVNAAQKAAQLLLVHLEPSPLTKIAVPSKVQACLACGTPILLAAEGEAADLLVRSGGGFTCRPRDPAALAGAVVRVMALSDAERRNIGARGRQYYEDELSFRRGVDKVESVYDRALGGSRRWT